MTEAAAPREHLSGVVAMGLGLLVVVVAVLALTALRASGLDGEALLRERFDVSELPFGLKVLRAFRLPQGEEVVILGDPDADPDAAALAAGVPELPAEEPPPMPEGLPPGMGPKYDWGKLPVGPELTPPAEVAFVWYPTGAARKLLEQQFGKLQFRDLKMIGWEGGSVPVDSGPVDWGDYATSYIRERVFEREDGRPVFHETARVNLTLGTRCCVLYMSWPRAMPGSKERILDVLEVVTPRPE